MICLRSAAIRPSLIRSGLRRRSVRIRGSALPIARHRASSRLTAPSNWDLLTKSISYGRWGWGLVGGRWRKLVSDTTMPSSGCCSCSP